MVGLPGKRSLRASLLVAVDRDRLYLGFRTFFGEDPSKGVLRRTVGRAPVEVGYLYLCQVGRSIL